MLWARLLTARRGKAGAELQPAMRNHRTFRSERPSEGKCSVPQSTIHQSRSQYIHKWDEWSSTCRAQTVFPRTLHGPTGSSPINHFLKSPFTSAVLLWKVLHQKYPTSFSSFLLEAVCLLPFPWFPSHSPGTATCKKPVEQLLNGGKINGLNSSSISWDPEPQRKHKALRKVALNGPMSWDPGIWASSHKQGKLRPFTNIIDTWKNDECFTSNYSQQWLPLHLLP